MEKDVVCGIPVRNYELKRHGLTTADIPDLRQFAEANRGQPDCQAMYRAWRVGRQV
jgi:hypothetical protein